jgi:hypothetical protein
VSIFRLLCGKGKGGDMLRFLQQHKKLACLLVLWVGVIGICGLPVPAVAQQPTATIQSISGGEVTVSLQGQNPVAATEGTALQAGDIIETQTGAEVVLLLSEGSEIRLGQQTRLDIAVLIERPKTKARKSFVKLVHGRIRALLSPGHQEEGSSFDVETPNTLAGVKFSQPDIEVIYDRETRTTIVIAHTVAVTVTNLLTKERITISQGQQAIVQDEFLWVTAFSPGIDTIPPEEKRRQHRTRMLLQPRPIVGGIVSSAPMSAGGRARTSQSPGMGASSDTPRPQTLTIGTTED